MIGERFTATDIPEVIEIRPRVFADSRGFFLESWNAASFAAAGVDARFVQDNHSRSIAGVLRGLHYQLRQPQGKLVRVVRGEVFDVAVDLRRASPSFGRWVGIRLSAERHNMLWIPPGFAHGFYVTAPEADLLYKCTTPYSPDDERTLRWDDPDLAIDWPLLEGAAPIVSDKDAAGAALRQAETYP